MIGAKFRSSIHWFQSWLSQAKTTNPDNLLNKPPDDIIQEFSQKLGQLSHPLEYRTSIQETLTSALADWQQNVTAANSLVILGCSVEPIAEIVQESLTDEFPKGLKIIHPLAQCKRSPDCSSLEKAISEALCSETESDSADDGGDANPELTQRQTLVVIPSLAQCFLRCIEGWEGIEFLQNAVVKDKSRFWLIGCNYSAWTFLDQVCQVSAYLEQVHPLPKLKGDALQKWLAPVTAQLTPEDSDADMDLADCKSLASLASGVSSVAAQLWLQALRIRAADIPDAVSESQPAFTPQGVTLEIPINLRQTKPILPSLPDLTATDRYLLHSLLLHGEMTRTDLALSLGESEQLVRSRVQMLQRAGVIMQHQGQLNIYPAYYPSLKTELINNNFLIGEE
ncbi:MULTISPECIES: MarR family transcriptional regulator [unclassified Nodularia (in: cyanobacteria)]|uniref:MarR family transcriptional regulator n=1 Tax=unclassified Nodularia (in: cyanobacteria) TaxID=2656917 RepID=UPI0018814C78|nr:MULTISPECIES: MarR family transcriptional regulator [unclassified Nodularia (in: cyanobacteria)]MBE9198557.1 MarR family transcriptional regulator [Nodularia sp. LEGE 06071]MCC2693591.1 MarR family transcriptional regulator [Nodularia sp. LEGE 04288]